MLSNLITCRCSRSRRGSVSIWAISCLILATVLSVTLGRIALSGSRYTMQERRHSQADWLAYAGWSLAQAQLSRNPDYKGETWVIPAAELGGADGGRVKIEVTAPESGDASAARTVQVVAQFPVNSDRQVQVTRRGTLPLSKPEKP